MILKLVLSVLGSAFAMGTIFWAGAAYNRLSSIETHMQSIDSKLDNYGQLNERVSELVKRADDLQQEIKVIDRRTRD